MSTIVSTTAARLQASLPIQRALVFVSVAVIEIFAASFLFGFRLPATLSWNPAHYASKLAQIAFLALPLFVIVCWPRRNEIINAEAAAAIEKGWKSALALNIGLFVGLMLVRMSFLHASGETSSAALLAYSLLVLATGASLALLAAPIAFWRRLLTAAPVEIAVAVAGGVIAFGAGTLARESWHTLSGATLALAHAILALYEQNVVLDSAQRILGADGFLVEVHKQCSGYEGMGLIAAFLSIYLWVFRRELRFPNAFLLFPAGMAAIWILNGVRIAALVSIGAHISPEVAVEGFHSQGGWIAFLFVTLGVIAVSRRIPFFIARPKAASPPAAMPQAKSGAQIALEFLAPFMALMAANIVASAFVPHDQWLYGLKVAAVGATLWCLRGVYGPLLTKVSPFSIAVGLAVGAIWIATDPGRNDETELGRWLAALPASLAILWLALRAAGSVILVPIAEELAFRGYLHRLLISARFENVGFGEYRMLAFLGSSLAFGLLHERWLAAALAGAVYALLMYRTKRLSDPIAAHIASNAAILLWAIAVGQWSLL